MFGSVLPWRLPGSIIWDMPHSYLSQADIGFESALYFLSNIEYWQHNLYEKYWCAIIVMKWHITAKIIRPNSPWPGVFFLIWSPKRRVAAKWLFASILSLFRRVKTHSNQIADESCRIINISGKIGFNCGILSVYRRQRVHLRQNGHLPGLY